MALNNISSIISQNQLMIHNSHHWFLS
jgi:hypothetical protein